MMIRRLKHLSLALGLAVTLVAPSVSQAQLTNSVTSQFFTPAGTHPNDYLTVYSSHTLPKQSWNAGFTLDWAKNPIEVGAPPGTRQAGIVNNTLIMNNYATYSILDWFAVGLNIPVYLLNDVNPLLTTGPAATFRDPTFTNFDKMTSIGDIMLRFKFRLRDNTDRLVGVALVPFITLPSGPELAFAGNGMLAGGLAVVVDFNINRRVQLALNLGGTLTGQTFIRNFEQSSRLNAALGLEVGIILDRLKFLVEGRMAPTFVQFFDNEVQVPAEVDGAFRIGLGTLRENGTRPFDITVGGGAGLTIGVASPDWRAFLGLNYNWSPAPCPECVAPAPQVRKITIDSKVHFAFDRAVIRPQSYPILDDVAAIIKSNQGSINRVLIEGNTDSIGSDQYNMRLSERRANAVRDYLVKKGVSANVLDTVGYGETRPVATNDTAEGRAKNRRVEFKVNQ